ncbi:MAG: hypothetical protein NVSMB5_06730 [Candidatus Velthaea sp.]
MTVIRSLRLPFVLSAAVVAFATAGTYAASAAPKGAPATASPTPAPSASPTAAPEPLDRAIPRLEAKIKADPADKASMLELASDYYQAQRPDLAFGVTQKLIAAGTKTAQVYYLDGVANVGLGRAKEGVADLENAANLEPTNMQVLGTLTNLYLQERRAADAERIAKRALTFNKENKEAYINYGQVLATEQKFDDARAQFATAAKLDPKDAHPVVLEGRTYADQNAVALASQVFDRAVAIDPTSQEALFNKARTAAAGHNVKDAVSAYDKLLQLQSSDDDRAAIVDEIARTYAIEKMASEADQTYRRALTDYPKAAGAHIAYGDYLAFNKDLAGAEREWLAGAGPNRDNPDALGRLGELYAGKNDRTKALDNYKRMTEVSPNDPRAFYALGTQYAAANQFDKARTAFKTSYSLSHTPESLVGLAQTDYAMKNYKECATIYDSLDKAAPQLTKQNPQILFVLGQCYQKSNDTSHARAAYVRFLAYVKPGSQASTQVKQLISDIDRSGKPAPKPASGPQKK